MDHRLSGTRIALVGIVMSRAYGEDSGHGNATYSLRRPALSRSQSFGWEERGGERVACKKCGCRCWRCADEFPKLTCPTAPFRCLCLLQSLCRKRSCQTPHHHVTIIVPLTLLSNWIAPFCLTSALPVDVASFSAPVEPHGPSPTLARPP